MRSLGVGGPAIECGVEPVQGFDGQVGQFGGECQIDLGTDVDAFQIRLIGNAGKRDAVVIVVIDDGADGEQFGYIALGLIGQIQ